MRSPVLFQQTPEVVEAWLAERREQGLDIRDEVREGVYVVITPARTLQQSWIVGQLITILMPLAEERGLRVVGIANVGQPLDYRIPDIVVFDPADVDSTGNWLRTAAVVAEIRPAETHEEKLPFYAGRAIPEVVLIDPASSTVRWLRLGGDGTYTNTDRSEVLDADVSAVVVTRVRWH